MWKSKMPWSHIVGYAREWLTDGGYGGRLIIMGRSLGSASALELAAAYGDAIDGLIIDSGFAHTVPLLRRLGAPIPEHIEDPLIGQLDNMRACTGPVLITTAAVRVYHFKRRARGGIGRGGRISFTGKAT